MLHPNLKFNISYCIIFILYRVIIIIMNPASLEAACLDKCIQLFKKLSSLKISSTIEVVHAYIYSYYPPSILSKLVQKLQYHQSDTLTLLLLPHLLMSGKIYLTDHNLVETILWLDTHPNLESKLSSIYSLNINISGTNYFKLYNFLPTMPNLKFLTMNSCTTDEILAKVGMYFKNIEIFDSRDDTSSTVTDAGLAFISHCKSLRILLFSNLVDEYDYEDKFKFTAKGVAMLIFSLPNLQRLECPEYLLSDALQFLYQMNYKNNSSPLKSINISFPSIPGTTVCILPYICPNLTTLSIYIKEYDETIVANALKHLVYLDKLQLSLEGQRSFQQLGFPNFGPNLKYLILRIASLSETDFAYLNKNCKQLEIFILQTNFYNYEQSDINFDIIPKFNALHSIEFISRISMKMFVIVNKQAPNVKALYCPNATIENFTAAVEEIFAHGYWTNLEVLVLPMFVPYQVSFIKSLLLTLSNLKVLAVSFSNTSYELEVRKFIAQHSISVKICDEDDITLPNRQFDITELPIWDMVT